MVQHKVAIFTPYPFQPGEKIHINQGPRRGDWLVLACDANKVTLQCPVSMRKFSWDIFCYHVEQKKQHWPADDDSSPN